MAIMDDVVERIKDIMSEDYPCAVLDKNVAYELGITPGALAVKKSRNHMPYDELTMFCIKYNVSTNWLFFGLGSKEMSYAEKDL